MSDTTITIIFIVFVVAMALYVKWADGCSFIMNCGKGR